MLLHGCHCHSRTRKVNDMKKIRVLSCPFCKEELEIVGKGHYFAHKNNNCILRHLCFEIDDDEAVKLWNTRKPIKRIVERLEQQKQQYKRREDDAKNINMTIQISEKYYGKSCSYDHAIEIVKEEGDLND